MAYYQSSYDKRGSGREGAFAQDLYHRTLKHYKIGFKESSIKEDCEGKDLRRLNGEEDDVKARKSAGPHRFWMEICAAFNAPIGSGWSYHNVWIAQLMVYEADQFITDIIFGRYFSPDAIRDIVEKKCDLNVTTRVSNELHKLYHRWSSNVKTGEMEHRGATVCATYEDLESVESFQRIEVPRDWWPDIMKEYNTLATIKAKGKKANPPYFGIK